MDFDKGEEEGGWRRKRRRRRIVLPEFRAEGEERYSSLLQTISKEIILHEILSHVIIVWIRERDKYDDYLPDARYKMKLYLCGILNDMDVEDDETRLMMPFGYFADDAGLKGVRLYSIFRNVKFALDVLYNSHRWFRLQKFVLSEDQFLKGGDSIDETFIYQPDELVDIVAFPHISPGQIVQLKSCDGAQLRATLFARQNVDGMLVAPEPMNGLRSLEKICQCVIMPAEDGHIAVPGKNLRMWENSVLLIPGKEKGVSSEMAKQWMDGVMLMMDKRLADEGTRRTRFQIFTDIEEEWKEEGKEDGFIIDLRHLDIYKVNVFAIENMVHRLSTLDRHWTRKKRLRAIKRMLYNVRLGPKVRKAELIFDDMLRRTGILQYAYRLFPYLTNLSLSNIIIPNWLNFSIFFNLESLSMERVTLDNELQMAYAVMPRLKELTILSTKLQFAGMENNMSKIEIFVYDLYNQIPFQDMHLQELRKLTLIRTNEYNVYPRWSTWNVMPKLIELRMISIEHLSTEIFKASTFPSMEVLWIQDKRKNSVSSFSGFGIDQLQSVKKLVLHNSVVMDHLMRNGTFPNLEDLAVTKTRIYNALHWRPTPALRRLYISSDTESRKLLFTWDAVKQVQEIRMSKMVLTPEEVNLIPKMNHLTKLVLHTCKIQTQGETFDMFLATQPFCEHLLELEIYDTTVTGDLWRERGLPNLQKLTFGSLNPYKSRKVILKYHESSLQPVLVSKNSQQRVVMMKQFSFFVNVYLPNVRSVRFLNIQEEPVLRWLPMPSLQEYQVLECGEFSEILRHFLNDRVQRRQ